MAGGNQEILVGSDLYISADETEITEGDSIQFTVRPIALGEDVITIYINNVSVYSTQNLGSDILYTHTFNESGEFSVYAEATYNNMQSQPIVITVEEANITLPTSQVSWEINNKDVKSIFIDNKEVQSIVMEDSGDILFQKSNDITNLPIMELEIQHNLDIYLHNPFTYTGRVFVDWGDNTGLIEYTGGELTHTYNSIDNYTVKIYGNITSLETSCFESCNGLTSITIPNSVTNLGEACFHSCKDLTSISIPSSVTSIGDYCFTECESLTSISIPSGVTSLGTFCFSRCESLTSINIPSGVTSLGAYCFEGCTSLTSIVIPNTVIFMGEYCFVSCYALTNIKLNFKASINILTYDSSWIIETNNLKFSIPNGTTSLYTDKGYPLEKLEEIYDEIELTTDKSILSYADNETCTLTVQLLKESVPFMVSGVTVEFFNGNISLGTALTNSNGIATKTYNSQGIGDLTVYASDGNIISGDILIEDCLYYSSLVSTNAIIAPWTDNCTVEYEVYAIDTWNWHYLLVFQEENQEHIATLSSSYDNSSSAPIKTTNFPPKNTWTPIQFKTENGTATVSSNGTVKGTTNISLSDLTSIKIYNSKSNTQQRNVKIKPL